MYGLYDSDINSAQGRGSFNLNSGINYHKLELNYGYFGLNNHQIDFGLSGILYAINPGIRTPEGEESNLETIQFDKQYGLESAFYLGDEIKLNDRMTLMLGLRYSMFAQFGADSVFVYESGMPRSRFTIQDTYYLMLANL